MEVTNNEMIYPKIYIDFERARWTFDDIDWDKFDASLLTDEQAQTI